MAADALDEYERIKPWENALLQGTKIMDELKSIINSDERIKSLSGMGLLLSLKFESTSITNRFCHLARNKGILFINGIVDNCSVLIRPSLLITEIEVEFILEGIRSSLHDLQMLFVRCINQSH